MAACRGTVGVALVGVLVLTEPVTALRALGIALIVGGVVVLRLAGLSEHPPARDVPWMTVCGRPLTGGP